MIGIFGGTFDPIHYGHIKPALSVKQALALSQLRFIPNRIPPHRETPWLSVEQRLSLLNCALGELSDVVIDERELQREGPSYMVDTLKSLQADFPGETLCLIIGMDAFYGISTWFEWQSIFDLCQLVVTTRPGFDEAEIRAHMSKADYQYLSAKMTNETNIFLAQESAAEQPQILLQSVPQLDISSTQIRKSLRDGKDISQWMPSPAYLKLRGFINDN